MTNFLRKLMFWRKPIDDEASGPVPSDGANDNTSRTQEELDYEANRREEYIKERRDQDDVAP